MAVVEVAYPVVLVACVARAAAEETPQVFVKLIWSAVPGFFLQGVDTESDVVQAFKPRYREWVVVAVQVARKERNSGAVELVVDGLHHETSLDKV